MMESERIVTKAIPSDVGHGRARISTPDDLGLESGDIVAIHGARRSTAAIYWRSRPEDAGSNILRVDGIIRKNAGIAVGDRVLVSKIEPQACERLVLSAVMPQEQAIGFGDSIEEFCRRGLNKRPVATGDRVYIPGLTLFSEVLPFMVMQTQPQGIVRVTNATSVVVRPESTTEEKASEELEGLNADEDVSEQTDEG
jgi:transitional endoplasmic reticulum ATPase